MVENKIMPIFPGVLEAPITATLSGSKSDFHLSPRPFIATTIQHMVKKEFNKLPFIKHYATIIEESLYYWGRKSGVALKKLYLCF